MHWLRFVLLVIAATILQVGIVGQNPGAAAGIRPDLLLVLLVFFATRCDPIDAVITSFALGFAADLLNPAAQFMGPQILSFGLFGTLLSDLHNVISIRRLPHQMGAIFLMGLVTSLLTYLLSLLRADAVPLSIAREFFWQPTLSAFIGPFLFPPIAWWMRMTKRGRRRAKSKSR